MQKGALRALLVSALSLVACAAAASSANAYIYWTASANNTIMRANNDGTNVITFIQGASAPAGVAVTSHYVYWADYADGDIGRASIDGTNVNQEFIAGGDHPDGVAVEGNYIYWANSGSGLHSIGRASLDGSGVNQQFVVMPTNPGAPSTGDANPYGIAADSNYLYATEPYYDYCNPYCDGGSIGRIRLDGSSPNYIFIATAGFPQGIAVNSSHLYWQDYSSGYIERANLDGTGIDTAFQNDAARKYAGGIALDGTYVYWAQSDPNAGGAVGSTGSIGRATLDDYNANQWWIGSNPVAYGQPWGIAVDNLAPPPTPTPGPGPGHGSGPNSPVPSARASCVVPKLKGRTLARARHALTKAHCRLGKVVKRKHHHARKGRVISSSPTAGKHLRSGGTINLVVAR